MAIATQNPATGETVRTFEAHTAEQVDAAIARAHATFQPWRRTSRSPNEPRWMHRAADLLDEDNETIAAIMTLEMGKTLKSAPRRGDQVREGHALLRRARRGASSPTSRSTPDAVGAQQAYGHYQPLGPVLAVMPWNFPLWQVVRFAAPALMAGNVGLLKHASNVPQCALYLEDLFRRAGFPEGAFTTLLIGVRRDVERVLRDPRVRAATLTGSEPAGQSVAAICGDEIKKTVLELGGTDAVRGHAVGRHRAGRRGRRHRPLPEQRPVLHRREAVHRAHRRLRRSSPRRSSPRMAALRVGDPIDDATDVGPLATESGRDDVEELVDDARAKGATVLCGGERPTAPAGSTRRPSSPT